MASTFDYAPNDDFVGTDFFTFEVVDSANSSHKSAVATVSITVEDTRPDSDGDGLSDERELEIGTDPQNADSDSDGITDGDELDLGTDPNESDTDGDGTSDGDELAAGTDPNEASSRPDTGAADETNGGLPLWLLYLITTANSPTS